MIEVRIEAAGAQAALVAIVAGWSLPAAIRAPERALALWRRNADEVLLGDLAALPHDEIDDIAARLPVADAALHAAALLGGAGYPASVAVPLARDVAMLVRLHAEIEGGDGATIRLEWVETDACRRFHSDQVTTRLLTTYVGRGTQWKAADESDGEARELAAGDVAIFKGRVLAPAAPILHRSPPIGGCGERRLLLVVDQAAQGGA